MPMMYPNPGMGNKKAIKIPSTKPKAKKGGMMAPLPIDDKVMRTMPITEKQLKGIKKMYGIK
jgi:hypothetical protein